MGLRGGALSPPAGDSPPSVHDASTSSLVGQQADAEPLGLLIAELVDTVANAVYTNAPRNYIVALISAIDESIKKVRAL